VLGDTSIDPHDWPACQQRRAGDSMSSASSASLSRRHWLGLTGSTVSTRSERRRFRLTGGEFNESAAGAAFSAPALLGLRRDAREFWEDGIFSRTHAYTSSARARSCSMGQHVADARSISVSRRSSRRLQVRCLLSSGSVREKNIAEHAGTRIRY
jgi:hypothetical protein